jgi:putative acyl-CoA dehydrogenase
MPAHRRDEVEPSGLSRVDGAQRPCRRAHLTWSPDGRLPAPPKVRAALYGAQVETGHLCPITMTRARSRPGGSAGPAGEDAFHRHPRLRPAAPADKTRNDARHGHDREAGRHRRTLNYVRGARRDAYRISGNTASAPMCDAFLVLAQADEGLTCFMPRLCRTDRSTRYSFSA